MHPENLRQYNQLKPVGRGATAQVYRASDGYKTVALKVFHPGLWSQPDLYERAIQELKTVAILNHANIVKLLDAHLDWDPPVAVYQFIDGGSLEEFQSRLPFVYPEISVAIVIEVLKALESAHAKGVIHRDLKPANILIQTDGHVFVSDFGLARVTDFSRLTLSGTILGSPDFMAPEQARGDTATAKSDVFSTSAILYFLVTGTKPFSRGAPLATLAAVIEAQFEPPQRRNPKLSSELAGLILKGLAKDPAERFASVKEFREALEQYLTRLGLGNLSLSNWIRSPSDQTMQGLSNMASFLIERTEHEIQSGRASEAMKTISHLSIIAPDSPAVSLLTQKVSKCRNRKRWPYLLLALLFIFGIGSGIYFTQKTSTPIPEAPPRSAKAPETAAPVAAAVPPEKPRPAVLAAPKVKKGKITFSLPADIKATLDGRAITTGTREITVPVGPHKLTLEKKGFPPIAQTIEVTDKEPTQIQVK